MRKGFTLVELSIVLVIVGLLIGGVLKGKGMIEGTKVKRVKSDVDGIVAAVYAYQDRFGAIPGDDDTVRTINGFNTVVGDGDGLIENTAEAWHAWQAIIAMGVVSGNFNAANEATIAKRSPYGDQYLLRATAADGNIIQTVMLNESIQLLDEKYDDGVFNTGDITSSAASYAATGNATLTWRAF